MRGYLYVTLAATLWGIAGATAKYLFATTPMPPFLLVQVRMGLSFLLLALVLRLFAPGLLKVRKTDRWFLAIWGIGGMAMVQFTYLTTIAQTNVATAIFLQYLAPILTALYAWAVQRQRLSTPLLLSLGLAMAGSILLIFGGTATLLISPLGLASGLLSAITFSFYSIYGAQGVNRVAPWTLLCYGLGFGTALWLCIDVILLVMGRPIPGLSVLGQPIMWAFFGFIAVLATIIPFGLYLIGLKSLAPTPATQTGMLEPVVGGLVAFIVLSERLKLVQVSGGALIVVAVILLQLRRSKSSALDGVIAADG
jgi:drug/metabolite transporter (DMT)-like permease